MWFEQHPSIDAIGGWYWFVFWQIHTIVPDRFRHALTKYDIGSDCEPWIFTHGRGSSAWHELWSYNGNQAKLIDGSFSAIVAEDGPIEEWFE